MSTPKEEFDKFTTLVSAIVRRPAMFGVSNIEGIYSFILGYSAGCYRNESEIIQDFMSEFRIFINEEFADDFSKKMDFDWPRLIRLYSGGDLHSIELFGRMFDKFLNTFKVAHQLN